MASFSNNTNTSLKNNENNDSVVNDTESPPPKVENLSEVKSFDELDIPESLLRGIYSHGFENPSPIQGKAINPVISGRDVIAQAQSGTGKTGSFLIGSMARVDLSILQPQVIVLCPNRELANQIFYNFESLNAYLGIKGALIMGGTGVEDNFKALDAGAQFIVGTPGRVYDMMKRYVLKTSKLKTFVMDEADEMLSKGFKDQVYEIFQFVPPNTQTCIFSATMPPHAIEITEKFMKNPVSLLIKAENVTLDGISQFYLGIEQETWKVATLFDLYDRLKINQTIIFVNSKRKAEVLKEQLEANNFVISIIHANLTQTERDKTMKSFRTGESRILIATDVIARGIDVHHVQVVINYDIPRHVETYIHRIGRSGRYGRKGIAINFVSEAEFEKLERIQNYYSTKIEPLPEDIRSIIGN
jgi:translation initiation factor 4A